MALTARARLLRAKLARTSRDLPADNPIVVELRRDYTAEVLTHHVADIVSAAPPFTKAQIDRIVGVLQGAAL